MRIAIAAVIMLFLNASVMADLEPTLDDPPTQVSTEQASSDSSIEPRLESSPSAESKPERVKTPNEPVRLQPLVTKEQVEQSESSPSKPRSSSPPRSSRSRSGDSGNTRSNRSTEKETNPSSATKQPEPVKPPTFNTPGSTKKSSNGQSGLDRESPPAKLDQETPEPTRDEVAKDKEKDEEIKVVEWKMRLFACLHREVQTSFFTIANIVLQALLLAGVAGVLAVCLVDGTKLFKRTPEWVDLLIVTASVLVGLLFPGFTFIKIVNGSGDIYGGIFGLLLKCGIGYELAILTAVVLFRENIAPWLRAARRAAIRAYRATIGKLFEGKPKPVAIPIESSPKEESTTTVPPSTTADAEVMADPKCIKCNGVLPDGCTCVVAVDENRCLVCGRLDPPDCRCGSKENEQEPEPEPELAFDVVCEGCGLIPRLCVCSTSESDASDADEEDPNEHQEDGEVEEKGAMTVDEMLADGSRTDLVGSDDDHEFIDPGEMGTPGGAIGTEDDDEEDRDDEWTLDFGLEEETDPDSNLCSTCGMELDPDGSCSVCDDESFDD